MNHENIIISLADRINSHLSDAIERFDLVVFSSDSVYAGFRNKDESIQVEIFKIDSTLNEVTVFTSTKMITRIVVTEKLSQFIIENINL